MVPATGVCVLMFYSVYEMNICKALMVL